MADIYKMDTDYLSAESVYDRTLGKKQSEINSGFSRASGVPTSTKGTFTNWSRVARTGDVVELTFRMTPSGNVSAWTEIATVPAGFRPRMDLNFLTAALYGDTYKMSQIQILTSGAVRSDTALTASQDFGFSVTYIK